MPRLFPIKRQLAFLLLAVVLSALGGFACDAAAWSLAEGARVHPPLRGQVPTGSDVVFSTRFKRQEAPRVMREFGATRVEWVYTDDAAFAQELKSVAGWYGGAVSANGPLPAGEGWARDFDGQPLTPPWMAGWGAKWVTTTHPETQQAYARQVAQQIAQGADSLQVDDALVQLHGAMHHGGDFNSATLEGFRQFLREHPDRQRLSRLGLAGFEGTYRDFLRARHGVRDAADYRSRFRSFPSTPLWLDYIRTTVDAHYRRLRLQAQEAKGGSVPLSMNLYSLTLPDASDGYLHVSRFVDYAMPETDIKDLATMVSMGATVRSLQLGWVPSIRPLGLAENRVAIATLYALGGQALVPWDVYDGNDAAGKARRFFGDPRDYADLYQFVRNHAALLDGRELAASVGIVIPVGKVDTMPVRRLVRLLVDNNVPFAFCPVDDSLPELDVKRLRHFRHLVLTNSEHDYDRQTMRAVSNSGVPHSLAADANPAFVYGLQPFVAAPRGGQMRLIPRSGRDGREVLVHVIDPARSGGAASGHACSRRIGVRGTAIAPQDIAAVSWVTPQGTARLEAKRVGRDTFFSTPDCPLWGILKIEIKH